MTRKFKIVLAAIFLVFITTSTTHANSLPLAGLGDWVWYDLDRNGLQDLNENGVKGVTVSLGQSSFGVADTILATTTTDSNGNFYFLDIPFNSPLTPYFLAFTLPTNWFFSPQDQGGDDTLDSDVSAFGKTGNIIFSSAGNDFSLDAGIYKDSGTAPPVPEPATMLLLGTGLVGVVGSRFRKKNKV